MEGGSQSKCGRGESSPAAPQGGLDPALPRAGSSAGEAERATAVPVAVAGQSPQAQVLPRGLLQCNPHSGRCIQGGAADDAMFSFLRDGGTGAHHLAWLVSLWNLTNLSGMTVVPNSPTHHVAPEPDPGRAGTCLTAQVLVPIRKLMDTGAPIKMRGCQAQPSVQPASVQAPSRVPDTAPGLGNAEQEETGAAQRSQPSKGRCPWACAGPLATRGGRARTSPGGSELRLLSEPDKAWRSRPLTDWHRAAFKTSQAEPPFWRAPGPSG